MRHLSIVTGLVAVAACVVASCGSSSPEATYKYPSTTSFCEGYAQAQCQPEVNDSCSLSNEECVSQQKIKCIDGAPSGSYDPTKAEACINKVGEVFKDAKVTYEELTAKVESCGPVFSGGGSANAACEKNTDCKQSDGLRCVVPVAESLTAERPAGTCQVPVEVGGGGECGSPESVCAAGYHCEPAETPHCNADYSKDKKCGPNLPCKEGLRCVETDSKMTCQDKLADKDECSSDGDCASNICLEKADGTFACAKQITLAAGLPVCKSLP